MNLCWFQMKLNPDKCVAGVPSRKLHGFIVSQRGIQVNPKKIAALSKLEASTKLKDVQKLAGCMAALSHFISQLGEKALPLYRLLKKIDNFVWTEGRSWPWRTSSRYWRPIPPWRHRAMTSLCFCILLPLTRLSVQCSWWSANRKATPTKSNARCTTSMKYDSMQVVVPAL